MLSVYYKDKEVGDLTQNEQGFLSFKYNERVLDEPDTHTISGVPSNVILKRPKARFGGLVQNELACMLLMKKAGLPIAESTVSAASVEIYESSRFDRIPREDGTILRLHQEDFCQATGKGEARKYQERGGPDLGRIRSVLEKHSILPIEDIELLLRWTIANLCIGNNDAHAKNLALLYTDDGIRLAPAYDVVSTVVYPFIDQTLAIYFGGRDRFEAIDAAAFNKFARSLGYKKPSFPRSIAEEVAESIVAGIREVCDFVTKSAGEDPILDEIIQRVEKRCHRLLEVLQKVT